MKLLTIESNLILMHVGSLFEPIRYFSVSPAIAKSSFVDFNFFVCRDNRQDPIESYAELLLCFNKADRYEQVITFYNGIEYRVYRDGSFLRRAIYPAEIVEFTEQAAC